MADGREIAVRNPHSTRPVSYTHLDLLEELNEALTQIHEQNAFYLDFLNIVGNAVKYNKPGGIIDLRDEILYTEET